MIPVVDCTVEAACSINPSEDEQKISQALSNILEDFELKIEPYSAIATARKLDSLTKIRESIQSHRSNNVYRRFLNNNLEGDETWFYLNKQAAFAGTVSLCEHDNESPLGPIKVTIRSKNIERIIEWLSP